MNKEQIYDEQISPLMVQIIAICKANGIAMVASYAIPTEEDEDLRCTTHLADGDGVFDPLIQAASKAAFGETGNAPMNIRVRHADGSQDLTVIFP